MYRQTGTLKGEEDGHGGWGVDGRDLMVAGSKETRVTKGVNSKRKKCTLIYTDCLSLELVNNIKKGTQEIIVQNILVIATYIYRYSLQGCSY